MLTIGLAAICFAGCTKNNQEEILYKNVDNLGVLEFNMQPVVEVYEEDIKPETPSYAIDNLEASGSAELTERTMMRRTYVYNKPDDTSSQLGRLEWGDTIQVIEETADAQWYKISYNGRVAYVTVANVRKETNEDTAAIIPVVLPTVSDNTVAGHTHNFVPATCTSPSKCSCGETKGGAMGHDYVGATCSRCYALDPNYHAPSNSAQSNTTPPSNNSDNDGNTGGTGTGNGGNTDTGSGGTGGSTDSGGSGDSGGNTDSGSSADAGGSSSDSGSSGDAGSSGDSGSDDTGSSEE